MNVYRDILHYILILLSICYKRSCKLFTFRPLYLNIFVCNHISCLKVWEYNTKCLGKCPFFDDSRINLYYISCIILYKNVSISFTWLWNCHAKSSWLYHCAFPALNRFTFTWNICCIINFWEDWLDLLEWDTLCVADITTEIDNGVLRITVVRQFYF